MTKTIEIVGNVSAIVGLVACVVSGVSRVVGDRVWGTYGVETVFLLGVSLLIVAILAKVHVIQVRR